MSMPENSPVRVNVKLCGSIPRRDMAGELGIESSLLHSVPLSPPSCSLPCLDKQCTSSQFTSSSRMSLNELMTKSTSLAPTLQRPRIEVFDAPSWAVPAKGESRLEPVCESIGRQHPVDLTTKASFLVGRAPSADVQLLHNTSSRQHALMFHHSNGSCYIVDCGSSHGTFLNGVRIASPCKAGIVVPHKVRRGSLIRFGGPGAPSFMLKAFSFKLDDVVEPVANHTSSQRKRPIPSVIQMNTRLNALGSTAAQSVLFSALSMKRSFEDSSDEDEPCPKRMRCFSPPLSPEQPLRLVSPDLPLTSKHRRVTFSPEPPVTFYPALVTPEELSGEEDNISI